MWPDDAASGKGVRPHPCERGTRPAASLSSQPDGQCTSPDSFTPGHRFLIALPRLGLLALALLVPTPAVPEDQDENPEQEGLPLEPGRRLQMTATEGLGYHWELWLVHSGGMTEHEALRVATLVGAEALGLSGDVGSLERGKLPDLLILDENLLDDIRHTNTVHRVMANGRLYDGDTLDDVFPRERRAGPWYWQEPADPDVRAGIRPGGDG